MTFYRFLSLFAVFMAFVSASALSSAQETQQVAGEENASLAMTEGDPVLEKAEEKEDQGTEVFYSGVDIEMPEIPYLAKAEIQEEMKFIKNDKPYDDEFSGYQLFIPKTWEQAPDDLMRHTIKNGLIYGDIASFYSDPVNPVRSKISIEAIDLEHNISAKSWLAKYFLDYGYVLEGIEGREWDKARALGVLYKDGSVDYRDMIEAQINGSRVILMKYSVPLFAWNGLKSIQATSVKSFQVTKIDDSNFQEMSEYEIPGYMSFSFPSFLTADDLSYADYDRPFVRFLNYEDDQEEHLAKKNKAKSSKGILIVQAIISENTGTSLTEEVEKQKESVKKYGLEITKKYKMENYRIVFPGGMHTGQLDVYKAENSNQKSAEFEVWIASMRNDYAYYFVTMITPSKDNRFFAWTENKSAFEGVLSSLVPIDIYADENYDE